VTGVSWEDAVKFAKYVDKRLPTEAEWEFAARGDTDNLYPWGREWCADCANAANASKQVEPVGWRARGASKFGVLDLSGNAAEWTADDYKAYPNGKIAPPRSGQTHLKVVRGGSFESTAVQATATARQGVPATPRDWGADEPRYQGIGFRCARNVQ
jgi:formylglycine-generating enzyme required for sulfatase activity